LFLGKEREKGEREEELNEPQKQQLEKRNFDSQFILFVRHVTNCVVRGAETKKAQKQRGNGGI
jgi:hypothetical protein